MGLNNSDGTPTSLDTAINNALYPNRNNNGDRLPVFGGESFGFAAGVSDSYAKSFYSKKAKPDGLGVPTSFSGELPRSIFNQYALFNYSGFYGNAAKDPLKLLNSTERTIQIYNTKQLISYMQNIIRKFH